MVRRPCPCELRSLTPFPGSLLLWSIDFLAGCAQNKNIHAFYARWQVSFDLLQHSAARCINSQRDAAQMTKTVDMGVRVTASLTKEQDQALRTLAARHQVSVAWLVRYAVSRLVDQAESLQLPLDLLGRP